MSRLYVCKEKSTGKHQMTVENIWDKREIKIGRNAAYVAKCVETTVKITTKMGRPALDHLGKMHALPVHVLSGLVCWTVVCPTPICI